jgi:hypothetical protein
MLTTRRKFEFAAVAIFLVANLAAPFCVGELYPFTVSPMFCDQPKEYCTFEVFDESGNSLAPAAVGLHLVYDGNPPGLGMGIQAKPTICEFGQVPSIGQIKSAVRNKFDSPKVYPGVATITVKRLHASGCDNKVVEVIEEFTVSRNVENE